MKKRRLPQQKATKRQKDISGFIARMMRENGKGGQSSAQTQLSRNQMVYLASESGLKLSLDRPYPPTPFPIERNLLIRSGFLSLMNRNKKKD